MSLEREFDLRRWLPGLVMGLAVALSLPPARVLIEQSMVWHMLVQMPLLVLAGWLAGRQWPAPRALERFNRFGLTGFAAAQGLAGYWMLPSSIDRAVVDTGADALKIATLWLCGAALRHAMQRAPPVVQVFFLGYTLPMAVWLGLYFASTDLRLCNAYSLQSQAATGIGLVALGVAAGALWIAGLTLRRRPGRA